MSCCLSYLFLLSFHSVLLSTSSITSVFVFKQKTAYEMRISDWSSDVCSSDLNWRFRPFRFLRGKRGLRRLSDVGGVKILQIFSGQIGRASCRERVCQYV